MGRYSSMGWMIALGLVALVLAPVVVLAGEPALRLNRRAWRSRQITATAGHTMAASRVGGFDLLLMRFSMHPLVIALTAPARWAGDRLRWLLRSRSARRREKLMRMGGGHERLFPDDPPFLSGVREPRRPKPTPPSDAIALQPPAEHSTLD